ncbi:M14 family metallopeptidase [Nitrogeniibacter aestuarii]|uniref:succinylglutamate desuccinylase/aspartoacylase domain-containing protein n=1 Tax=Nitrogeniibacter aestuarii TaxID=2815343 RepID=UPI001E5818BC|nr:succinylglutamate desuccinylase/aspartoacylase family protein [Nitrogeniibacter aestuarii]
MSNQAAQFGSTADFSTFKHLHEPRPEALGEDHASFLAQLDHPLCITLGGHDTTRTRVLVTLLHGNEPSGFIALHRWLRASKRPATNVVCLIASIEAARREPGFTHRALPGARDLNRCFRPPFDTDAPGRLAGQMLTLIEQLRPEAVIDVHNTSGSGPSFAVSINADARHLALVSLFTRRLVLTDLRLGSLMEISEHLVPTVTIECGGRLDANAHTVAWAGIDHYFTRDTLWDALPADDAIEIMYNPVRLELTETCELAYARAPVSDVPLTLRPDIEHHNFGLTPAGTHLGWVHGAGLRDLFVARNTAHTCVLEDLVSLSSGELRTKRPLKLFMITTNPVIAKSDCLFYAVQDDGLEVTPSGQVSADAV